MNAELLLNANGIDKKSGSESTDSDFGLGDSAQATASAGEPRAKTHRKLKLG